MAKGMHKGIRETRQSGPYRFGGAVWDKDGNLLTEIRRPKGKHKVTSLEKRLAAFSNANHLQDKHKQHKPGSNKK